MNIDEFWNNAFLANLHHKSPTEAKELADQALEICLKHWDTKRYEWAPNWRPWCAQNVTSYQKKEVHENMINED